MMAAGSAGGSSARAYDVVIVGGAVHGASAAYHIAAHPGFSGRVLLVEKDPTFAFAASALSAASIRQQFSDPTNIAISLHGIEFLRGIGETLPVFETANINLVWIGIILVKYIEIGMLTPPVGLNVFVMKGVVGDAVRLTDIFKGVTWFLLAEVMVMAILIFFPQVTLFLPNYMN